MIMSFDFGIDDYLICMELRCIDKKIKSNIYFIL